MKRLLATISTLVAFSALAASPVAAPPPTPQDLRAWSKVGQLRCVRQDKVVIALEVYERIGKTVGQVHLVMTKDGKLVHQFEEMLNTETHVHTGVGYVLRPNGTWMSYDWKTEQVAAEAAINDIVGLSAKEFTSCASKR